MSRTIMLALALSGCGGKVYDSSCGAGGAPCGGDGTCNEGTQWAARKCLPGDKCVDAAKHLCEQVLTK